MTESYTFALLVLHCEEHQEGIEENPGPDPSMLVHKFLCFCLYFYFV
jgi:hypothetical protein